MSEVNIGIDIGTSSIKALALDSSGSILAKARQSSTLVCEKPGTLEHNAMESWWQGTKNIWGEIRHKLKDQKISDKDISGVCVAAMVPSLTAVDSDNQPQSPGILYGDQRGGINPGSPMENGQFLNFLKWTAEHYPNARGYWPAQTVANMALGGVPALDTLTALTTMPVFSGEGWDENICDEIAISPKQLPILAESSEVVAEIGSAKLLAGTTDAFCELMVLEPQQAGDVIAVFGSTLICWSVVETRQPAGNDADAAAPLNGLWEFPHGEEGLSMYGGPSNAGGLFIDKLQKFLQKNRFFDEKLINLQVSEKPDSDGLQLEDSSRIPVWLPYIYGERTPLNNPSLTASLHGLDLSHTRAHILRAGYEATGFVIRRHIEMAKELTGTSARRIIAAGGGSQSFSWMEAVADATGLPVEIVQAPEGAALGAAWTANAGLGSNGGLLAASGLNPTIRTVEPNPNWVKSAEERYQRFLSLH